MIKSQRFSKTYDISSAEMIGEGNFAQVYRVFDQNLHKYIAIRKVIKSKEDLVDIQKEREINEELRKCSSPYILEIFEIVDGENCIYYLTEYCAGESLWHALNNTRNHRFSEEDTLKCILYIARGVQQLHNQRITHRDLKPENILLTSKYVKGRELPDLKIADFGLSTKNIIMETVAGTKEYIAPQQAKFHTYTNAVDVWSLGIIFDELLHGQPYYTGSDNKEVFEKIIKLDYKVRNSQISAPIQQLLTKIIRKKAYERPIIASIISEIQGILKKTEKEEVVRGKSQTSNKTQQKKILLNIENKYRNSRVQYQQDIEPEQMKIPLFKTERRKGNLGTKKKLEISKEYLTMEGFVLDVLEERDSVELELELSKSIQFNPSSKISPIEYQNPLPRVFTEQKRQFQYLNEICHDQEYQIKIKQTKGKLHTCTTQLKEKSHSSRNDLKQLLLSQIDDYMEEYLTKLIL